MSEPVVAAAGHKYPPSPYDVLRDAIDTYLDTDAFSEQEMIGAWQYAGLEAGDAIGAQAALRTVRRALKELGERRD